MISSPVNVRHGSASYWKNKYEQVVNVLANNSEKSVCLEEIPGFMKVSKVKPKLGKENICVKQVHGSLEGKLAAENC